MHAFLLNLYILLLLYIMGTLSLFLFSKKVKLGCEKQRSNDCIANVDVEPIILFLN